MYHLKNMDDEQAIQILQNLLQQLSELDEEDMTTFELGVVHACATEPPKRKYGVDQQLWK